MTSADTLLPCPFCGGEARISRAHQNKMLAMGEVPTDEHYLFTLYHDCANGITICWTYKPKDALIAAWNRRTPPTPVTDEREAVAQWCSGCHEVRSVDCYRAGCPKSDTEEREAVALEDCPIGLFISKYGSLCLKTEYGDNNGRIDAYIVSSGEMFWGEPPQTVASQRASMVTPVDYAAEILAAEARGAERERARKGTVTTYKYGFGPGDGDSAIEHGAGK